MSAPPDRPAGTLAFAPAVPDGAEAWLLLDGREIGWCEPFHDPLLEADTLRLWLHAEPLSGDQLRAVSAQLARLLDGRAGRGSIQTVESSRIFPIQRAEPASVLLRIGPGTAPCGACRWRLTDCDEWFVDQLVASFRDGCRRFGVCPAEEKLRRYVTDDLTAYPDWQWWSSEWNGGRSGVVVSCGHEDLGDGRPYAQCVDAVGHHSSHFSCLAAQLRGDLGCEVRGEVTVGLERPRERRIIARLHDEGWRLRGLTSVMRPTERSEGGDDHASSGFGHLPYQAHGGQTEEPQAVIRH
jgi:hypothetical protein